MFRGILSTIYIETKSGVNFNKVQKNLKEYHKNNSFVRVVKPNTNISTNNVINTNYCNLSICKTKYNNRIIILSAIDNLIKGGAGQAVQNMNIRFNFKKNEGFK